MSLVRLSLIAISLALIVWALVQMFAVPQDLAELEVRVENANLSLSGSEYVVQVYDAIDRSLVAEGDRSDKAVLLLAPGEYDVRVTVPGVWPTQVSSRTGLAVPGGTRTRADFEFSFGELALRHETSTTPEDTEVVTVQVFTRPRGATPVIGFVAGETVKLKAGSYDVRVVRTVATREKQVRWLEGIDIEQGRLRQLAVAFERGLLLVDASNQGQPIPSGQGTVTLFEAGDETEQIVETGSVNVPIYLPTGTYDLRVVYQASNDRPAREAESVTIVDGESQVVSVEFNSGDVVVHASTATGQPLAGYEAYIYLYQRDDHRSAIAYVPAGQLLRVSAGRYDIRANLFRSADQPDEWLRDVAVTANQSVELEAIFQVGDVIVRVFDQQGREQTGDEYTVTIHPPGNRSRPVHRMQVGTRARLTAGPVGLQVVNTYSGASQWLDAEVLSGETTEIILDAQGSGWEPGRR